jgi:hypothetical protein
MMGMMWTEALAGAAGGALVGTAGAYAAEALHLALRRQRNATFINVGELPYKDEVFRPKWLLLGAAGMLLSGGSRALGASLFAALAAALVLPALLALAGIWFLRR